VGVGHDTTRRLADEVADLRGDFVSRTQHLATRGWAAAIGDMRPGMWWLSDGRLQISADDCPPRTIRDAELIVIPGCPDWLQPRVHRH